MNINPDEINVSWIHDGVPVWYREKKLEKMGGKREHIFAGVVHGDPTRMLSGRWVVRLIEMDENYQKKYGVMTVPIAGAEFVSPREIK